MDPLIAVALEEFQNMVEETTAESDGESEGSEGESESIAIDLNEASKTNIINAYPSPFFQYIQQKKYNIMVIFFVGMISVLYY